VDLKFETEAAFTQDSQAWLASRFGVDGARPITLDLSLFTKATHFPNGFIPSGIVLAKITAGGLYAPYITGSLVAGQADARGHLLSAVEVKSTNETGKAAAALLVRGVVKESRLPANHGLDSLAKADMGPTSALADGQAASIRYE
jgi:hypothetical protein